MVVPRGHGTEPLHPPGHHRSPLLDLADRARRAAVRTLRTASASRCRAPLVLGHRVASSRPKSAVSAIVRQNWTHWKPPQVIPDLAPAPQCGSRRATGIVSRIAETDQLDLGPVRSSPATSASDEFASSCRCERQWKGTVNHCGAFLPPLRLHDARKGPARLVLFFPGQFCHNSCGFAGAVRAPSLPMALANCEPVVKEAPPHACSSEDPAFVATATRAAWAATRRRGPLRRIAQGLGAEGASLWRLSTEATCPNGKAWHTSTGSLAFGGSPR